MHLFSVIIIHILCFLLPKCLCSCFKVEVMVKCNKSSTHNQKPVKFRAKSLEGPYFEIADFAGESFDNNSSNDNKHARENLSSQSPRIMSTRDLISTVGQIWDCASRSLSRFQPKESFDSSGTVSVKDNDAHYLVRNDSFGIIDFIDRRYLHVDLNPSSYFSCIMQHSLKFKEQFEGCNIAHTMII